MDDELERANVKATNLHIAANSKAPSASLPGSKEERDRQAFDTYVRLCKGGGETPGESMIPHNFEQGTVDYAHRVVDKLLAEKTRSERQGEGFYVPTEKKELLNIAAGVLEQQNDNPDAKNKAALARKETAGTATNTAQQLTSFMAWQEWKKKPELLPEQEDFSIDAALVYANEILAQNASKKEAMRSPLKELLDDAIELIAEEKKFKQQFAEQKKFAVLRAEADPIMKDLLANFEPQQVAGEPPPPPPPRARTTVQANPGNKPEPTPLPTAPPPPAPAPRRENLPYLIGRLPSWSDKQLELIAASAFPLSSVQVRRALQGLRSLDRSFAGTSSATQPESVVDGIQRQLNYDSQLQVEKERIAENLEYAHMLVDRIRPEVLQKADAAFAPLLALHERRAELLARIDAELQGLLPPKAAPASRKT